LAKALLANFILFFFHPSYSFLKLPFVWHTFVPAGYWPRLTMGGSSDGPRQDRRRDKRPAADNRDSDYRSWYRIFIELGRDPEPSPENRLLFLFLSQIFTEKGQQLDLLHEDRSAGPSISPSLNDPGPPLRLRSPGSVPDELLYMSNRQDQNYIAENLQSHSGVTLPSNYNDPSPAISNHAGLSQHSGVSDIDFITSESPAQQHLFSVSSSGAYSHSVQCSTCNNGQVREFYEGGQQYMDYTQDELGFDRREDFVMEDAMSWSPSEQYDQSSSQDPVCFNFP
jgi:hypothetical protein